MGAKRFIKMGIMQPLAPKQPSQKPVVKGGLRMGTGLPIRQVPKAPGLLTKAIRPKPPTGARAAGEAANLELAYAEAPVRNLYSKARKAGEGANLELAYAEAPVRDAYRKAGKGANLELAYAEAPVRTAFSKLAPRTGGALGRARKTPASGLQQKKPLFKIR